MNADQLQEKLTKGIIKACSQISAAIAFFILYSASAATDVFYRRGFGQRFLTPVRAIFGLAGWSASMGTEIYFEYNGAFTFPPLPWTVCLGSEVITTAYLVTAVIRLREIRARINAGEIWHSRSRGESVFGQKAKYLQPICDVVAIGILLFLLPYTVLFYILSRTLGYMADVIAAHRFYNRLLDIRDAQIEAAHMEEALRKSTGLHAALPRTSQAGKALNVVKVVVGGSSGNVPIPAIRNFRPEGRLRRLIRRLRLINVGSRPFFIFVVLTTLPPALFWTHELYKFVEQKWHHGSPATSPGSPLAPKLNYAPPASLAIQPEHVDQPENAELLAEQKRQADEAQRRAQEKLADERRQEAEEQRLREQKAREEQDRLAARRAAIDALALEIDQQKQEFQNFKAASVGKYQDNTNRIAKVLLWSQDSLTATNDGLWVRLVVLVSNQNEVFKRADEVVAQLKQDSSAPVDQHKARFAEAFAEIENERKSFQKDIDDLNAKIRKTRQHLLKKND